MAYTKYYVVFEGRQPGIYTTWEDCKNEIEGFPNAKYKAYYNQDEAAKAFRENSDDASILICIANHLKSDKPDYYDNPEVDLDSLAVDASCMGNPGIMEYRGVHLRSGKEVFKVGPFQQGTNNIGEFLALVHGLALLKSKGSNMTIYSDSMTAQKWVRNKKCNTKLQPTSANADLYKLVVRAENWLRNNTYSNRIIKWDTERWGEIPADFGRK